MSRRLKITLAVVALQLVTALPPAAVHAARGGAALAGRRSLMSQEGGPKGGRRRAADALSPGVWGGERIRLEVTEGGAKIEYDCAHGTVEGRIVVDARGRFNVAGTHYEERGGPVRAGESAPQYPVRLAGRVGGSLMKLTVTRADTKEVLGTFTLARGREAELVKCR